MSLMPGTWGTVGTDWVVVLLLAVVFAGFWAACKVADLRKDRKR